MTSKHKRASAKGSRWQKRLRDLLEKAGARVETAPNIVRWLPRQAWMKPGAGDLVPVSLRHDFFNVFDLLVAWPDGRLELWQVTDRANAAHRRARIVGSGFPVTDRCVLATYQPRRGFAVLRGPVFLAEQTLETLLEKKRS